MDRDAREQVGKDLKADKDEIDEWLKKKVPSVNYIAFCIDELHQAWANDDAKKGNAPELPDKACGNCQYFEGGSESVGQCRRSAPAPIHPIMYVLAEYLAHIGWATADSESANWRRHETASTTLWPVVSKHDCCGEHAHNARQTGTSSEHATSDDAEPAAKTTDDKP